MFTRTLVTAPLTLALAVTFNAPPAGTLAAATADHEPDPAAQDQPAASKFSRIIATGDIATCGNDGHPAHLAKKTGDLAQARRAAAKKGQYPLRFVGLGDENNGTGTKSAFTNCYQPTGWGNQDIFTVTYPSPGNHEYRKSKTAAGYFWYFGKLTHGHGTKKKPYYAFNFGGWHFISLDSQCDPKHPEEGTVPGGGCKKNSAQEKWLLKNLKSFREKNKNDPKKCILAYFHEPLFSSANGSRTAPYKDRPVYPLWKDLYNYRTAIVLNGHYHDYERFTPLNQNGQARKNGVREFVVATGGSDPWFGFRENPKISKKQIHHEPGVLELTLKPHSYTWHFYHTEGAQGDSGKGTCPTYKKQ